MAPPFQCCIWDIGLGTAQESILTSGRRSLPANQDFRRPFRADNRGSRINSLGKFAGSELAVHLAARPGLWNGGSYFLIPDQSLTTNSLRICFPMRPRLWVPDGSRRRDVRVSYAVFPGGVAAINHRLQIAKPPASKLRHLRIFPHPRKIAEPGFRKTWGAAVSWRKPTRCCPASYRVHSACRARFLPAA